MIKNKYAAFILFIIAVLVFWNLLDCPKHTGTVLLC